jgi:restriction system protein
MMEVFGLIFLALLLLYMWSSTYVSGAKRKEEFKLNELVDKHELALRNNWHQTVFEDEYGRLHLGNWGAEVARFINSTGFEFQIMKDHEVLDFVTKKILKTSKPATNSNKLFDSHDPYGFEAHCAERLRNNGWKAQPTKKSGDQGADVIAVKNGISVAIQCKLYSKPVGNKAVQEVISGKLYNSTDFAVVVASKGYTRSAKKLAQKTGVLLLSPNDLEKLEKYL